MLYKESSKYTIWLRSAANANKMLDLWRIWKRLKKRLNFESVLRLYGHIRSFPALGNKGR